MCHDDISEKIETKKLFINHKEIVEILKAHYEERGVFFWGGVNIETNGT